jgi:hypothetical protein
MSERKPTPWGCFAVIMAIVVTVGLCIWSNIDAKNRWSRSSPVQWNIERADCNSRGSVTTVWVLISPGQLVSYSPGLLFPDDLFSIRQRVIQDIPDSGQRYIEVGPLNHTRDVYMDVHLRAGELPTQYGTSTHGKFGEW